MNERKMLTDFEIEYEEAIKKGDMPFPDILKLAKRKNTRERILYLVQNAIANDAAEELE